MKKRILILLAVLATTALAFSPLCRAVASLTVYGYTDKTYYKPGDSGTLNFWLYNDGTEDLILKNLTILYPWNNPAGLWAGNETIVPSTSTVIAAGGNWSSTSSFTVPNDGRALVIGSIRITVVTDKTTESSTIPLSVTSGSYPFFLQNMDQLVTWFTILVALMVVCTLIIAAAIFFSRSRRQTMWKPEEKPQ